MRFVLRHISKYKWYAILAPLFKMLEAVFELLVPLVVAAMIDRGIAGNDRGFVIRMGLVLLVLALCGTTVSITAQYFAALTAVRSVEGMRSDVYRHIMSFSEKTFNATGSPSMLTILTNDMNQVQGGINMALRLLLRSPFIVLGAVIMGSAISRRASFLFLGVVFILSFFVAFLMKKTIPMYGTIANGLSGLLVLVRENLEGVRIIRAFAGEQKERSTFSERNQGLYDLVMRAGTLQSALNPVTFVMINLAIVLLLGSGGREVYAGSLSRGEVVALYNYMGQILVELIKFATLVVQITRAIASAGRIEHLMGLMPDERIFNTCSGGISDEASCGSAISFIDAAFSYTGKKNAVSDLGFEIAKGCITGIIGGTGSGKSTIAHLILHDYDVSSGEVRLFGKNINEYSDEEIASITAYVPQKTMLFSGTIEDNLRLGAAEADEDTLIQALKDAQAYEFVMEKGGLSAEVKKSGTNFSGGQRQRLCIARALAKGGRILILDDATSALDAATERRLLSALKKKGELTIVVIAQRAAVLKNADNILVMDQGWCIGSGTEEELLEKNSVYREIYEAGI